MNYQEAIAWTEQNYPDQPQSVKLEIAKYVIQKSALDRQGQIAQNATDQQGNSIASGVAGVGIPVAGKLALDHLLPEAGKAAVRQGAYLGTLPSGGSAAAKTGSVYLGKIPSGGGTVTNQLPAGSKVTANGDVIDKGTGLKIGKTVQGVAGAYQIYQGVQDFKDDKVGGSLGIASGGANVGAALGNQTLGAAAAPLAIAKGGYDVFNAQQNGGEGMRSGMTTLGAGIGSMVLPGVGTAIGAAGGNVLGYGLQGDGFKNDLALAGMTGGLSLIPGVGDGIRGLIRKTTKQYQSEGWNNLAKDVGENNPTAQYLADYQKEIANPQNKNPARFEDMKGLDLTPGKAFFDTFKNDWLEKFTEPQRIQIAQAAKDKGLISSRKGDIVTSDPDAIRALSGQFLGNQIQPPQANPIQNSPANRMQTQPAQTPQQSASWLAATTGLSNAQGQQVYRPLAQPQMPGMLNGLQIQNSSANRLYNPYENKPAPAPQQAQPNILANTIPAGGVGGAGYKPDPNRPGHFIRK